MKTDSIHFLATLVVSTTLVLNACRASQSPAPTPVPSLIASPSTVASSPSPSPQPTIPGDPFEKASNKAASARILAQDAQTAEDWNLVSSQWQRAIDFMQAVPRSDRNYAAAQKLLPSYRQALARAQQIAKQGGRRPSAIAANNSKGGIPLIVAVPGSDAASTIATLNQQQIEFFTQQKRFAVNLAELKSTISTDNPNYLFVTVGSGNNRATSRAIAKQSGLPSYTGTVFATKDAQNNDTTVAIVCVTAQPSRTAPAPPQLDGKEAKCPAGSSRL